MSPQNLPGARSPVAGHWLSVTCTNLSLPSPIGAKVFSSSENKIARSCKSGNPALYSKSLREKACLAASKLDHKFSGWWQHLSVHPEGRELNKLRFTITGSCIPAAFPQKAEQGACVKCGGFGEPGGAAVVGKAQWWAARDPLCCVWSAALNVCRQFEIQYSGGETSHGGGVCCDLLLLMEFFVSPFIQSNSS